jgi:hypothetical protein
MGAPMGIQMLTASRPTLIRKWPLPSTPHSKLVQGMQLASSYSPDWALHHTLGTGPIALRELAEKSATRFRV